MSENNTNSQQSFNALIRHLRPAWVPERAIRFTHTFGLGRSVPWVEQKQRSTCPCHAVEFDIRGAVVNSPAPRPLDLLEVPVEDGVVKVDMGRMIRRESYEPGQAVRV